MSLCRVHLHRVRRLLAAALVPAVSLDVVPPALVLAVLIWTFLKMDDKITALQKRVEELETAQKAAARKSDENS